MSTIWLSKYEGAGNDFILIDDRTSFFPVKKDLIQRLCHRKLGIGADGLILLQNHKKADFRMRIFNSDGGEAESCGNGLRCLLRFIADLGMDEKTYRIALGSKIVEAGFIENRIFIDLGQASQIALNQQIENWQVHFVDTGVPHAVVFVPDVQAIPFKKDAAFLRHHSFFKPQGANVNFAALQSDGSLRVRTFERGVEEETLACGTGAAASALIASRIYPLMSPILIRFAGGEIDVHFNDLLQTKIIGPAVRTFSGFFHL